MANPTWVTAENIKFNKVLDNAAVLKDTGSVRTVILWDDLSAADQTILINAVDANGGTVPLAGPTAGHQTLSFGGTVVGGNATGLDTTASATSGTATIDLNGVAVAGNPSGLTVTGSTSGYQTVNFNNDITTTSSTGFDALSAGSQAVHFTAAKAGGDPTGLAINTAGTATIAFTATPAVTPATVPGIIGAKTFEVNVDAAGATVYTTAALAGTESMTQIAAAMSAVVGFTATVTAVGNAFVVTSPTTGSSSSIIVTNPATTGADIFDAINTALTATHTNVPVTGTTPVYTATVTVDAVAKPISIVGNAAQTFTTLLSELGTDLGASATVAIVGNDIVITSATTGIASSVAITAGTLFPALANYGSLLPAVAGKGITTPVTASITIDAVLKSYSVARDTLLTFADVISTVQTAVGAAGTVSMVGPSIKVISATTGLTSTVRIVDGTLIAALAGNGRIQPPHDGVNEATVYRAVITIDGTTLASMGTTGLEGDTYQHVIDALNVDLGASATAAISGGNIVITSATTGKSSSVSVADTGFLFNSLTGYVKISSASGVSPTAYTASVVVDGVAKPISINGSAAQTFTTLVSEINTDLGVAATATISGGNIVITSATTGVTSTVQVVSDTIFHKVTGYLGELAPVPGATDFEAVMRSTRAPNGTSLYESFAIQHVGLKPAVPPFCPHTVDFIYWGGVGPVWRYLDNDVAV